MGEELRPASTRRRPRRMIARAVAVAAVVLLASGCINNGAWSVLPAPVAPVQGLVTQMEDVSCVSEDWCMAVGWMGLYPLAEVWDGSSWSVITAPSLNGETNTHAVEVECGSSTSCVATVTRMLPSPDLIDYAVAWDGEEWHELAGSEGPYVDLFPSACASDGSCLVVDNRFEKTMVWDGGVLTTFPTTPGWDVNDIDCFSADLCVAALSYSTAIWNGAAWSELPGSSTSDIFVEGAHTIGCTDVDDCVAVGPNAAETGPTSATWDGVAWTEVALPAGTTYTGSLECVDGDGCLIPVAGADQMLAWMAGAWHPAPGGYWDFSCVPGRCVGVSATGSPIVPIAGAYDWTNT